MAETFCTITDVARVAGVSVSTVSRILNGKQDVAPATRQRVQQVIDQLGFKPHAQARGLRAGRTRNVALLFPLKSPGDVSYNALEVEFILGAAAAAGRREFLFSLLTSQINQDSLFNSYRSAQVDGLVLMHIHAHDWRIELLRKTNYPFVMIGHCADNNGLNFVDLDFRIGVITAFEHLISLGHRYIAFLGLPSDMRQEGYGPAVRGWDGYKHVLRVHNLMPLNREVGYSGQDIFQATLDLFDEEPRITAIVTTHELATVSIGQALKHKGREIPADCSVIAMMTDRIAEISTLITYLQFPAYQMGYRAFEMLIRCVEGESNEPEQVLIPPELIVRGSTARPRES
jgi:LacI family transcriptional regulator